MNKENHKLRPEWVKKDYGSYFTEWTTKAKLKQVSSAIYSMAHASYLLKLKTRD